MEITLNVMGKFARWVFLTSKKAAWAPILVFCSHIVLLRVFHIYDSYPALDIPMHFLGGVVIAYFIHHAVNMAMVLEALGAPNRLFVTVTVFALACTATIIWEFAEFALDRHLGTRAQLGLEDTLGDMLMGMIGAAVFLSLPGFRQRTRL